MADMHQWLPLHEAGSVDIESWFAGSKVVDARGKPLVVYHGSKHKFSKFDLTRGRTEAAFFTDSEIAASGYGRTIGFYLKVTNPAIFDFKGHYWNNYNPPKGDWAIFKDGVMVKTKGFFDSEFEAEDELEAGEAIDHSPEAETTNSLAETAKARGHDGCIFKRVRDTSDTIDFDEPHIVYVVFSPDQIRRAPVTPSG